MSENSTLHLQSSHRSIRKFKDRPVEGSLLRELVKTAQSASTSHHVQAYVVIHVKNRAVRKQMAELAGPQPWVELAPVFLVFCADLTRLKTVCLSKGLAPESAWAEQFIVATVDTALLAQNLMIAAESQGLGGVFIGGIRNDPDKVCDLLNIPELAYPVFGMCLGYPDHRPDVKPRLPLDLVLREDTFQGTLGEESLGKKLADYDQIMREYYLSRDSNTKDQTWQNQMADYMSRIIRPHMKSFLEKRGFFRK